VGTSFCSWRAHFLSILPQAIERAAVLDLLEIEPVVC
jgi:hypothetical protein